MYKRQGKTRTARAADTVLLQDCTQFFHFHSRLLQSCSVINNSHNRGVHRRVGNAATDPGRAALGDQHILADACADIVDCHLSLIHI